MRSCGMLLDLRDFPGDVMEDKVVKDINLITQNPEISIVVETMVEQSRHMLRKGLS